MGCSIHLHIEVKIDDKWRHYNHPNVNRSYDLFTKMAGVRHGSNPDISPLSAPRGLPSDMSFMTKYDADYTCDDGHSRSYLSSQEIAELDEWGRRDMDWSLFWLEDQCGFLFGNSFAGFLKYPGDYPADVEDVRFVFWFDN